MSINPNFSLLNYTKYFYRNYTILFRTAPCEPDDIRCGDGQCVPKSARCDNRFDCVDGVDERDCALCSPDQFRCDNGQCISDNKKCNGQPDCADSSDELDCCKFEYFFA